MIITAIMLSGFLILSMCVLALEEPEERKEHYERERD